MKKFHLFSIVLAILLLSACVPKNEFDPKSSSTADPARAEEILIDYFNYLSEGHYGDAVNLYGGSFETLRSYNPALAPDDYEGLFQAACEVNGFKCLPVNEILAVEKVSPTEMIITTNFLTKNGEIFEIGPCCGASVEDDPPQSEFQFRVAFDDSGEYRVLDLPVYAP